ncbi:hypothetical protein Cni_G15631 [Canna indica]|uniref:DEUBAD domain-containing protein n=1 Tax=Canna indica TaxID=4628 RepID=A0AAQ3KE50_9LILI|nr:hypothetical protein Cni_G15631 [Canna indica]
MAIVKNDIRVLRADGDSSPGSRRTSSSQEDDEEPCTRSAKVESDASETSDMDSGMESDEFDPMELGEAGSTLCQVGNQSCSIPLELYDIPDLGSVLSLETWNDCLSEEERFALAEYLPDMDQETFGHTLRELLSGQNLHFGSPLNTFLTQLKGGLYDPRIVLSRRISIFLQQREYYHCLCKYQNSMVRNLSWIRDAWQNCAGYCFEEKLQLLNVLRNQRSLSYERNGDVGSETDSESGELDEWYLNKRFKMDQQFAKPSLEDMHLGVSMAQDMVKFGKEYSKGVLKVAASKASADENGGAGIRYPSAPKHRMDSKNRKVMPQLPLPQQDKFVGYDVRASKRNTHCVGGDPDDAEKGYLGERSTVAMSSLLKTGMKQESQKKYDIGMYSDEDPGNSNTFTRSKKKNMIADQAVTIASYGHESSDHAKKVKYSERDRMYPTAARAQSHMLTPPMEQNKMLEEAISSGHLVKSDDRSKRDKKLKVGIKYKAGRSGAGYDLNNNSDEPVLLQKGDTYLHMDPRPRIQRGNVKNSFAQYERLNVDYSGGATIISQSEETESDSSEQVEDDGGIDPVARNFRHQISDVGGNHSGVLRSAYDSKKPNKLRKVDRKGYSDYLDANRDIHSPDVGPNSMKGKHGRLVKKGLAPNASGKLTYSEKKHKGVVDVDHSPQQSFYSHDYGNGLIDEYVENLDGVSSMRGSKYLTNRQGNLMEVSDIYGIDATHERSNVPLSECNSAPKKHRRRDNYHHPNETDEPHHLDSSPKQQNDELNVSRKGKRKLDAEFDALTGVASDLVISEKSVGDAEVKAKTQRKPFTLITPTIHTGFSFSIVHLLSSVRRAMITPNVEEQNKIDQFANGTILCHSLESMDKHSEIAGKNNLPSLTVLDIVDRVRSNPGDPCILETQEPLQDLVRGVLKIFSSKTAPLGAKGWKPLVLYEKSNRSWYWAGPVASTSSDNDNAEEETSSEAWGIPHKMLVKLVDAFSNWLKSGQDTLQQIGSLPPPPASLLSNMDGKERFKDIRAQKSLNTISPSSDEVRAYFRREEFLRYSVPDRAFSYTAADGKKSIVAPLRRGGGKPTSKARDHFMLKHDRPPHVTILCLVRDAAARLPGSIGTRADVCTLLRDSQYIVEEVSDLKLNQVVSGALDRLHYERDPCVQFDNERKLWVYLHRDREEEDFEDDGTSSTKKWKRQKKDSSDETGAVNDENGTPTVGGFSAGLDNDYDLNVDTSSIRAGEKAELAYEDMVPNMDNIDPLMDSSTVSKSHGNWEGVGLNQLRENSLVCQENSTDEDFDDEHMVERGPFSFSTTIL